MNLEILGRYTDFEPDVWHVIIRIDIHRITEFTIRSQGYRKDGLFSGYDEIKIKKIPQRSEQKPRETEGR